MTSMLQHEIKQSRPFASPEQEAMLSIERTAAVLMHTFGERVREFGVTATQYNVLRILRGAGDTGLCRTEVRDRLVAQVPDVTRLLDRLEKEGLITRDRDTEDRRLVLTRITREGLSLLKRLDPVVEETHEHQLGHLSKAQLRSLIHLLSLVREGA